MNREEAIKEFSENIASDLINEGKKEFDKNFAENEKKLESLILKSINNLIRKLKLVEKRDISYKLAVFHFELLRINVLDENYKIWLHGYNNSWYLDENSIYEEIDLKFLFEPFIKIKQILKEKKKVYIGKINDYDIENIMFAPIAECYNSMSERARRWLWDLDEEEWMNDEVVSDFYTVKWGEYHGKSEALFVMDNREKNIKDVLELKKEPEEKKPYVYTVWKNSDLKECELTGKNMLFINFKKSKLTKIDFSDSDVVMAQFKDTHIKDCQFKNSRLTGTSFKGAIIEDSNFNKAECFGVNFNNAEFNYVDFSDANLKNANFASAKFKNVSFENANVQEATFSEKDIPFIHLTSEQLQTIYIEGGRR